MPQKTAAPNPLRARREEEKEERRQAILDAAEQVIAEQGWESANFGEIAKRSRLSRTLVYFYFRDREELFDAICARGLAKLEKRFGAALKRNEVGLEQAMAMGRAYLEFSKSDPLHFQVLTRVHGQHAETSVADHPVRLSDELGQRCLGLVVQALRHGLEDGSVNKGIGDPGLTAVSVWAFTHGLIQIAAMKEPMLERAFGATAKRTIDHGFSVLRSSLASR